MVVASAVVPDAPNARIARIRAAGATPRSCERAAIAPAIAVPWKCGRSDVPSASKLPAITPASSGCPRSTPESITATSTLLPRDRLCASASRSLASMYCAPRIADGAVPTAATTGVGVGICRAGGVKPGGGRADSLADLVSLQAAVEILRLRRNHGRAQQRGIVAHRAEHHAHRTSIGDPATEEDRVRQREAEASRPASGCAAAANSLIASGPKAPVNSTSTSFDTKRFSFGGGMSMPALLRGPCGPLGGARAAHRRPSAPSELITTLRFGAARRGPGPGPTGPPPPMTGGGGGPIGPS